MVFAPERAAATSRMFLKCVRTYAPLERAAVKVIGSKYCAQMAGQSLGNGSQNITSWWNRSPIRTLFGVRMEGSSGVASHLENGLRQ